MPAASVGCEALGVLVVRNLKQTLPAASASEHGLYPGRIHSSQGTGGLRGFTVWMPWMKPNCVSSGHTGLFPVIHHHRGRDKGHQLRLLISIGSPPSDSENISLSAWSILVHSKVHTTFFVSCRRRSRIFLTMECRPECFPVAPVLCLFS